MSSIVPKMTWKFEVATKDLKLIRRTLDLHGGEAAVELSRKITNQLNSARKEFIIAIDAALVVEEEIEPQKKIKKEEKS